MRNAIRIAAATALLLGGTPAASAAPPDDKPKKLYCWDEGGHKICGDALPAAELPISSGIRTAVASGLAPAVLSILAVRDDVDAGRLARVPVTDLRIVRELRAVRRPDGELPPVLRALLRVARSVG